MTKLSKKRMKEAVKPRSEVSARAERKGYSSHILPQLEPTLRLYREDPRLKEHAEGVKQAFTIFLDDFLPTPRPSRQEGPMVDVLADMAHEKGYHAEVDPANNIGIVIPATPGYEDADTFIGQFHTDIVAAKGEHAKSDPAEGNIKPKVLDINGEQWLRAEDDTTLGSDDGAGAAAILQAAFDVANEKDANGDPIPHGPILILGTSREEVGLLGAKEMDFDPEGVVGKLLPRVKHILNSDGEQEGKVTVGSIGGEQLIVRMPIAFEPLPSDMDVITLSVHNLRGGHSGAYAHHPGGIAVAAEWLQNVKDVDTLGMRFVSLSTTNEFDNAIPQDAKITVAVPTGVKKQFIEQLAEDAPKSLQAKYAEDPVGFAIEFPASRDVDVMDSESSQKTLTLFTELGKMQGVDGYSEAFGEKLLDRSMNIAVMAVEDNTLKFVTFSRVGKPELFKTYPDQLEAIAQPLGADVELENIVPIWKPNLESPLPEQLQQIHMDLFGQPAELEVAPGGLETAIFDGLLPQADEIGNGCTIVDAHKAGERVKMASVGDCYIFDKAIFGQWRNEAVARFNQRNSSSRRLVA